MESGRVESLTEGFFMWHEFRYIQDSFRYSSSSRSPRFTFSDSEYYMTALKTDLEHILFVYQLDDFPPQSIFVTIWLYVKGKLEKHSGRMCKTTNKFFPEQWMTHSRFDLNTFPSNANLFFCELRNLSEEEKPPGLQKKSEDVEDSDEVETDPKYKSLIQLQKDFENLFKSGEGCDVTLKVQNKEFPAHRSILRARSPVFKSMFSHETLEKLSGVVVIDDCEPDTFPDFLNFLYSGNINQISEKNACHLFTASDKYQVAELKEECAKFIKSHLSVETFCSILTLAVMHAEQQLIDSATEFFCANAVEIVKTPKWQVFLKENSTVGNELFLQFSVKMTKSRNFH